MNNEQLQQFGDLVSDAAPDPKHSHETKRITTRCSTDFIRTAGTKEEALLSVTVGGQHIALWLNPSEAMAVAASLVAQVMRIANAKDAEQ
jgi:hypothetical protein